MYVLLSCLLRVCFTMRVETPGAWTGCHAKRLAMLPKASRVIILGVMMGQTGKTLLGFCWFGHCLLYSILLYYSSAVMHCMVGAHCAAYCAAYCTAR